MRAIKNTLTELVGLVVEDGYVAVGAVTALIAAYALTRDRALGPREAVGWILVVLTAASLIGSLVRTARHHRAGPE
jgi:hypothetical protein